MEINKEQQPMTKIETLGKKKYKDYINYRNSTNSAINKVFGDFFNLLSQECNTLPKALEMSKKIRDEQF